MKINSKSGSKYHNNHNSKEDIVRMEGFIDIMGTAVLHGYGIERVSLPMNINVYMFNLTSFNCGCGGSWWWQRWDWGIHWITCGMGKRYAVLWEDTTATKWVSTCCRFIAGDVSCLQQDRKESSCWLCKFVVYYIYTRCVVLILLCRVIPILRVMLKVSNIKGVSHVTNLWQEQWSIQEASQEMWRGPGGQFPPPPTFFMGGYAPPLFT